MQKSSALDNDGISTGASFLQVSPAPLLALPDVVWRSCQFRVSPRLSMEGRDPDLDDIDVNLPAELRAAEAERRTEFLAARVCAGLALRALGFPELVGRTGRVPIWPDGTRGSISHSGNIAIAAVTRGAVCLSVDYQHGFSQDVSAQIRDLVMIADENGHKPAEMSSSDYATLIFSAKESVYKALMFEGKRVPEFHDAVVLHVGADRILLHFEGCVGVHYRRCFDGFVTAIVGRPRS